MLTGWGRHGGREGGRKLPQTPTCSWIWRHEEKALWLGGWLPLASPPSLPHASLCGGWWHMVGPGRRTGHAALTKSPSPLFTHSLTHSSLPCLPVRLHQPLGFNLLSGNTKALLPASYLICTCSPSFMNECDWLWSEQGLPLRTSLAPLTSCYV